MVMVSGRLRQKINRTVCPSLRHKDWWLLRGQLNLESLGLYRDGDLVSRNLELGNSGLPFCPKLRDPLVLPFHVIVESKKVRAWGLVQPLMVELGKLRPREKRSHNNEVQSAGLGNRTPGIRLVLTLLLPDIAPLSLWALWPLNFNLLLRSGTYLL